MNPCHLSRIVVILAMMLAPAPALAQSSDYDDPLLSGYGNPGAAEQQLFGARTLPPRGGGGNGAGVAGSTGSGSPELRAPAVAPVASTPRPQGSSPGGKKGAPPAGTSEPSGSAPAAAGDPQALLAPAPYAGRLRPDADRAALPLGVQDLALAGVFLLALLAIAAAMRRRTMQPLGS